MSEQQEPETRHRVLAILARVSGREAGSIRPQDDLAVDLGINSPRALELLVELEDGLAIEIQDEEAAAMRTVGDVLELAQRKTLA